MECQLSDSIDFEHEYEIEGGIIPLFVSMEFSIVTEHGYGADADGNRGKSVSFLEPEPIVIELENGLDITFSVAKHLPDLHKELTEEATRLAQKQADDPDYGVYDNYN